MRYIWQHIKTIIESYNGSIPLAHFLKNYFRVNPKLGSRDRKILSEMAYCWYRCSKGFDEATPFENKLVACLYLCDTEARHTISYLPLAWQESKSHYITAKISQLAKENISFDINKIAPFDAELSNGIKKEDWLYSMLSQPRLFIRVRNKRVVTTILDQNEINYHWQNDNCISLPNTTSIDTLLPSETYVVQDYSSQQTGNYFQPKDNESWWDCCSGAGGKSLLLKDLDKNISLTVSDKRDTILHNLTERFKLYQLGKPDSFVLDMDNAEHIKSALGNKQFDHIICDVPCTGSGTWARTPEQLYFFDSKELERISLLQTTIAINAASYLKTGGSLFYITCSVFRQENENVLNSILKQTGLSLVKQQLINGINYKADSMFIAVLKKN
jgi:16S rRNA (cytosine967-C5)-methyltransferase